MNTIYFDNAATTHPKPECVYKTFDKIARAGGSPGRSAHSVSLKASEAVFETRVKLAGYLGIKNPERLIFTPGCTYSINIVLRGMDWRAGDIVIVSALEHNAVMRPLAYLEKEYGIVVKKLAYLKERVVDTVELKNLLRDYGQQVRICVFTEASNLTGEKLDLSELAQICRAARIPFLVDAAQSAGVYSSNLGDLEPDFWACSGHKGLFGLSGLGLLYVSENYELNPLVYGGTGSRSEELNMPIYYPDRLEAGTMSAALIASLGAGIDHLIEIGKEHIIAKERMLKESFIDWLMSQSEYIIYSSKIFGHLPIVSFSCKSMDSTRIAELLDQEFSICVRAGYHCASSAHKSLHTTREGLVRVSFSHFNEISELDYLCQSLSKLVQN